MIKSAETAAYKEWDNVLTFCTEHKTAIAGD